MLLVRTLCLGLLAIAPPALAATGADGPLNPAPVGSHNVASADPALPRPDTKPCVVSLLRGQTFGKTGDAARMDTAPLNVAYRPPAECAGPWAKVILEARFAVAAGHQYDRTASIWLDGVNLYFGTTQEPSPGIARSWQVQRDLTDYSALLRDPGQVQVLINNWLGPVFSSPIKVDARLLFYPASPAFPAPHSPDAVYALNRPGHTPAKLDRRHRRLTRTLVFPRNTSGVYLDVFAEPQAHDEFYYVCLDTKTIERVGQPLSSGSLDRDRTCDGGSLRQVLVSIDGTPAGLAPVTPYLFTGALDPFLWQPTPGPEALNFLPYRVNLSPFAGQLSDGQPHAVALQVVDTPNFFAVAGTLLVYQDPQVTHTGGRVTTNTLADADLRAERSDTLTGQAKNGRGVNGGSAIRAHTNYVIEGTINGSQGPVTARVQTAIGFDNTQRYHTTDANHVRHLSWQHARADTRASRTRDGHTLRSRRTITEYTIKADTTGYPGQGPELHRDVQVAQHFTRHVEQRQPGLLPYVADTRNGLVGSGRLTFQRGQRASYRADHQDATQYFAYSNSLGDCYRAQVSSLQRKVSQRSHGAGCLTPGALHWFVRPDGAPDSFGWRQDAPATTKPQP